MNIEWARVKLLIDRDMARLGAMLLGMFREAHLIVD
jgi:hypothetical protein